MARLLRYLGVAVLLLALIGGGVYAGLLYFARPGEHLAGVSGDDQKGLLATAIENALSTPGMRISIGAVDGPLSSDAVIRDVVISDEQGPWLRLDRARIIWTRSALLLGQLIVRNLEIGHLELLRRPIPAATPEAPPSDSAPFSGFSAPSLPIKVAIDSFSLAQLDLGEDVIGVAARLSAQGHASLGRPSDGLDLVFDLKRQDAPGALGLSLSYAPKSTLLKIDAATHEPAGGLIAHAARLEGLPPVDLDLKGEGPLDAFQANLQFSAGPLASVGGGARLSRRDAARALMLDLDGAIEKLLPPWLGPVFQGKTKLAGAVLFGDDGSYGLDKFQIAAKQARLDANGRLGADQILDGHVTLRAGNDDGGAARAGGAEIGALEFQLDAAGPLLAPKLDARLHVADASVPAARIGRLDANATARPDGPATDAATHVDFVADAAGEDLSFSDEGLDAALGGKLALTLRARAAPSGDADVSVAKLATGAGEVEASGAFGLTLLKGRVAFAAPDLGRFAALAKMALAGSFKGSLDLSGSPAQGRIDAKVAATGEKLATGIAAADAMIGGKAEIAGALGKSADGFHFDGLTLATPNFTARLDGQATRATADVSFVADAPDLARLSRDVTGRARAHGRLTGSLAHPDAAFTLALSDVRSMGRAIPRLNVDIAANDLVAAPSARIALDGIVGGKPAKGALTVARGTQSVWRLAADNLSLGSVAVAGSGALTAGKFLDGALRLRADDLDDLSPLALQKLAGRLDGQFTFSSEGGKQSGAVQLKASGLRAAQASLERLDLDARGSDLYGAPKLDANAALDRATFAGESIPRLRFTSKAAADASDFNLSTEARGIQVESRGRLFASTPLRIELGSFEARGAGQRITLAGPARFAFPAGGVDIRGFALASGAGRLNVDGTAGETLDLNISARALPLALARIAAPDLALDGALDASVRIAGKASAPTGDWRLELARLSAPPLRSAGLPAVGLKASGRLQGGRTTVNAALSMPRGGSAQADGFLPLDTASAMDLTIRAALDAAVANVAMATGGQTVRGRLTIDARAQGSPQRPQLSGSANLANGSFDDPLAGIRFDQIAASLRARGDEVVIERFTAATRGGGTISVGGNVRVAPDAGFPASLRVTGQRAELVSNDYVTAIANLGLDISGPLARRPRIGGKIAFDSIDVRVPDQIPSSSRPLENTVQVDPTAAARARLALEARSKAKHARRGAPRPAFNADLNIAVSAPSRIFVRGHGMDAELGGDLTVTGDLSAPVTHGAFQLRRGAFTLAGKRLTFNRGNVFFAGGTIPQLDFAAQTSAGDVTATIAITGAADQPSFAFSSSPELPQDEVISRLLFASSSGGLSPVQALQLAQTVAEFSGNGGAGVLERMRRQLGVDSLDVQFGPDGNPRLGASRYITRNVTIGVQTGAKPADNAVTIGVDVTKRLRVQGEAAADGSTSAGVATQWEY
jgi:translocation and assembly module TamB